MADKILVIDDTKVIREFLDEFFTDAGFEVETAVNGRIGYEKAISNDYALVVCDVHMPEMNGADMVVSLKQIKPDTPVIMMDSLPGKEAKKARASGALGCLAKPFDLNELRDLTRKVMAFKKA